MMKPLTNEEICSRFERLLEIKDAQKRQQATEKVVGDVLRASSFLPKKIVKKYKGLNNHDDLYQVACIVLLKAIRSFDYTRSRNFYAWCYRWIKKEVARAALQHKRYLEKNNITDLNLLMGELADLDLDEVVFEQECGEAIKEAVGNLGENAQYIINKVFGIDSPEYSLRQISEEIQVSHEQVRRMKSRALEQLGSNRVLAKLWSGET